MSVAEGLCLLPVYPYQKSSGGASLLSISSLKGGGKYEAPLETTLKMKNIEEIAIAAIDCPHPIDYYLRSSFRL